MSLIYMAAHFGREKKKKKNEKLDLIKNENNNSR